MTHVPLWLAVALYVPVALTIWSSAMSASGDVMTRAVKPVPALTNAPVVVPAANSSSLGVDVVTLPLLADELEPTADAVWSSGLTASIPLYSTTRRSTYAAAVLKVAVTVLLVLAA